VNEDGATTDSVDVRAPIGVEIAFTVLDYGTPIFPKLKLRDAQGNTLFNALDTAPRWRQPTEPGDYVSTAWISGNFLNEGLTSVDVTIARLGLVKLIPKADAREAVSFHVHDPGEGDSAKGIFRGQLRGPLRPLLEWTSEER
jgi:lipopolysaccharide transport system ATP-binding protein